MIQLLASLVLAGPPAIDAISPEPLLIGATAKVVGSGFVPEATSVSIAAVAQQILFDADDEIVFLVGLDTPVGAADLVVTTGVGQAMAPVTVAPAPPKIDQVVPDPLVMGSLATIQGTDLDTVSAVTLADVPVEITEQTTSLIVISVPIAEALIGLQDLAVSGEAGAHSVTVTVMPPPPEIDQIAPNPVRQGDLVTVSGKLVSPTLILHAGVFEMTILERTESALLAQVPPQLAAGPHELTALDGGVASAPAGPLYVEVASPERPVVSAVYPSVVVQGGSVVAVGEHLAAVNQSVGLELDSCGDRSCRLPAVDLEVGTHVAALISPMGTATLTINVVPDDRGELPALASAEPSPVFHGGELRLSGQGLLGVTAVVLGGVEQPIVFLDAQTVVVTVVEATPLGAEEVFVAGRSASNALTVSVLAPFDTRNPVPDSDQNEAPEPAEPGPAPDPDSDPVEPTAAEPAATTEGGGGGGGCAAASHSAVPPPIAFLGLLLFAAMWRPRTPNRGEIS